MHKDIDKVVKSAEGDYSLTKKQKLLRLQIKNTVKMDTFLVKKNVKSKDDAAPGSSREVAETSNPREKTTVAIDRDNDNRLPSTSAATGSSIDADVDVKKTRM